MFTAMEPLPPPPGWVPLESMGRLVLALGVGLFVGLEREWRKKEAGLRTFGLVALFGGIGGMLGTPYAVLSVALSGVLVVFLNLHSMRSNQGTELTTSAALLVTAITGVLCGLGHRVTPVAVAMIATALLSWKESLADFGHKLTGEELRSAILLGILAFTVYPLLPAHALDPWGMVVPRTAWLTVVLIAGIGFVNYILWKVFGTRGMEFAGFLGGLVNSTLTVTELATRTAETGGILDDVVYRGVLLSISAMAVRNALILGILQLKGLVAAGATLGLMFACSAGMALLTRRPPASLAGEGEPLALKSPFSLRSALKFGVIFLVFQCIGTIAQSFLGRFGFYAVTFLGGLISSASACAAAAVLGEQGKISPVVAGIAVVLASLASAAVNVGLVARLSRSKSLTRRVAAATAVVLAVGLAGALLTEELVARAA